MKKIIILTIALLLIALCIGGIRYWVLYHPIHSSSAHRPPKLSIPVNITVATNRTTYPHLSATGYLMYQQQTDLVTQQAGYISHIFFKYGQTITKGTLLVTIDNAQQKQKMASYHAVYLKNKNTYHLQQKLKPYMAANDLQQQKYTTLQSQADYLTQKAIYQQTFIRAPFDGIISDSLYTEGSYVDTNTKLATLYNPQTLIAAYQIGQLYHALIKKGQPVTIKLANGSQLKAHITYVSPTIDTTSNGFDINATLDHPTNMTTGGMSIEVNQTLALPEQHITIPGTALLSNLAGFYVYIVKNNSALEHTVIPGQRLGDQIVIQTGLHPGDQVISAGQQNIHDGAQVTIIKSLPNNEPAHEAH